MEGLKNRRKPLICIYFYLISFTGIIHIRHLAEIKKQSL